MTNIKKAQVKDFYETMKNDPKKIIAWCKREIKAYQELIRFNIKLTTRVSPR